MNKSATSKEALLEIARDISYREGISKVSIRRLASESGVAIGTVYNYYPSKADLVAEIMGTSGEMCSMGVISTRRVGISWEVWRRYIGDFP